METLIVMNPWNWEWESVLHKSHWWAWGRADPQQGTGYAVTKRRLRNIRCKDSWWPYSPPQAFFLPSKLNDGYSCWTLRKYGSSWCVMSQDSILYALWSYPSTSFPCIASVIHHSETVLRVLKQVLFNPLCNSVDEENQLYLILL